MSLERKMARQKRFRERTIKKGTAYRRIIAAGGRAIHATKGRGHPLAIIDYRASLIAKAAGLPLDYSS